MIQNCIYGNPLEVIKTGDLIELKYPVATNVNFQWGSSTCSYTGTTEIIDTSGASTTLGFSYGDILTNYFLFIIMVAMITGFLINKFIIRR